MGSQGSPATTGWHMQVGQIFKEAAEVGKQRNMTVYAKIQVCNSHEVATVPYIPVPGILYDKYKYMHEYNVRGVLYCWYFGSYPSLMNKAAGELAFAPFYRSKQEFLKHLAAIYWGREAEKAVEAWNLFEAGYTNYPINMAFSGLVLWLTDLSASSLKACRFTGFKHLENY